MNLYYTENYREMSRKAANLLAAQVARKPDSVLGLATGSTPVGLYAALQEDHQTCGLSFAACRTVNLDEYCGLAPEDPQSYAYFMQKMLFSGLDIEPGNTHLPDGKNPDAQAECSRYERLIASLGGIDLQVLGLGHNGHIGFNEPSDAFPVETHRVKLTARTIAANARFFPKAEAVPKYAYTMGLRAILQAKRILLLVSGTEKAEILERVLFGPVTPQVPGSILQLASHLDVCADAEALSAVLRKHPEVVQDTGNPEKTDR